MTEDYTFTYTSNTPRATFRVEHPALLITFFDQKQTFAVKNISAGGVKFMPSSTQKEAFDTKTTYHAVLKINGKEITPPLSIQMLYFSPSGIAGRFVDLDHRTEAALDKLILEIQKQKITLQKNDTDTCEKKSQEA